MTNGTEEPRRAVYVRIPLGDAEHHILDGLKTACELKFSLDIYRTSYLVTSPIFDPYFPGEVIPSMGFSTFMSYYRRCLSDAQAEERLGGGPVFSLPEKDEEVFDQVVEDLTESPSCRLIP